jgi:hypothetical protein
MSLPAEISDVPDRLSQIALDLRKSVKAIREARPSEAVMNETSQLVLIIAALGSESARLRGLCGASRATGAMDFPVVKAEDLDLRSKRLPEQVSEELLLASLHRAGDHTLDREEGEP